MKKTPSKKLNLSKKADVSGISGGSIRSYIGELKAEIKRINWTSREELLTYTKIVVLSTIALGVGIFGIDLFMQTCVDGVGAIIHWVFG